MSVLTYERGDLTARTQARAVMQGEDWLQASSGLLLPPSVIPPRTAPIALDLFCGAGGFSCGFHSAGFHVAAACEWDFWATMTYLVNMGSPDTRIVLLGDDARAEWEKKYGQKDAPTREDWGTGWLAAVERGETEGDDDCCTDRCEVFYFGDVRELSGEKVIEDLGRTVDCIMGGPPCQGFSVAGKRDVMDERNSLVFDFMRLVCEVRPGAFVMENVPNMLSMKTPEGVPVIDALSRIAEDGDYSSYDAMRRMLTDMHGVSGGPVPRDKPARPKRDDDQVDDVEEELEQMELNL